MSIDKNRFVASLAQAASDSELQVFDPNHRPRGLAERSDLESLALTYLEEQRKHWPDLAQSKLLPKPTPGTLTTMAESFEANYVSAEPPTFEATKLPSGVNIAAVYARYSDANSNPRSLNQQLLNALAGAARDRQFVPWAYVFADAATTGTNENRFGYQLVLSLIPRTSSAIKTLYIDELGRASRDMIASLSLGRTIDASGKRLVGVTDGFDSANPMSKMQLTMFSMMNEMFVDQIRAKVGRGMHDAFREGKPLYEPGYGYELKPTLNTNGDPVLSQDGSCVQYVVINEEEAAQVRRIFNYYVYEKKSPQEIARLLNIEQVGNRSWTDSQIRIMLRRNMYEGRETWGKSTKQFDAKANVTKTIQKPKDEWQWRDIPHLRIIDERTWDAAQTRLSERSRAYNFKDPSLSRSEANPKRLFHLVCGHCGSQMWCEKGGDRTVVRCYKGTQRSSVCVASAGKTLKQIEESLLNQLLSELDSKSFLDDLLAQANAYLAELASLPTNDVAPLQALIEKKRSVRDRIIKRLAEAEDDQMLDRIFESVTKLEKEIEELKNQIKQFAVDEASLAPIRREDLQAIIGSLRDLLYEDVALAGSVLGATAGPVKLMQSEPLPGKKRNQWTAEFMFNHAKVFVEIARQLNCPSTNTWEFLSLRSWTFGETVSVAIRLIGNAERIAKPAFEMISAGSTRNTVAVALAVDLETLDSAIRYWEDGGRCFLPPKDLSIRREQPGSKVEKIGAEVVRLVDDEKLSFVLIAKQLNVSSSLVSRAYKQQKSTETIALAKEGKTLPSGPRLKLSTEVHKRIRELLVEDKLSFRAIAREVGCDHHAVSEAKKRMLRENAA